MLWVLDASLNVSMEPFRAFVGDMLRTDQHSVGYSVQTAFIGAGAVVGSIFPWLLEHLGISNVAAPGALLVVPLHDGELLDDVPAEDHDVAVGAVVLPRDGVVHLSP